MESLAHTDREKNAHGLVLRALDPSLQRQEEDAVRCLVCSRLCALREGSVGYCTAMANRGGRLYSTAYGVIGEVSVTPIENRPVYHYRPGTRTLCLGGLACNLRCAFCQNWEVAFRDARDGGKLAAPNVTPEQAVELALQHHCAGLAWTFNEPSIAPMYLLDCARLAHEAGLYTVLVTNGLMTHQALTLLGPYIDVYRVDLKSLDSAFYRRVASMTRIADILPVARRAQQEFSIHVETVTNLVPGLNDGDEHLQRLARAIVHYLGVNVPWHLTTYVPYAHMTDIPPTPPERLARARALGAQAGLHFIYTDDLSDRNAAHTFCPECGTCVIERGGSSVSLRFVGEDGTCLVCGYALAIVTNAA